MKQNDNTALHLFETEKQLVLTTKKELAPIVKRYVQGTSNTLSQAAVETLAIIAYKQPITRSEVELIRGVQVSGAIQRLTAHQLIEEKGESMDQVARSCTGPQVIFRLFWSEIANELPDIQDIERSLEEDAPP